MNIKENYKQLDYCLDYSLKAKSHICHIGLQKIFSVMFLELQIILDQTRQLMQQWEI